YNRQDLQTHHPGQERTVPPDPDPTPMNTHPAHHPGHTTRPPRLLRRLLQHRLPPPTTRRSHHPPGSLDHHPQNPSPHPTHPDDDLAPTTGHPLGLSLRRSSPDLHPLPDRQGLRRRTRPPALRRPHRGNLRQRRHPHHHLPPPTP